MIGKLGLAFVLLGTLTCLGCTSNSRKSQKAIDPATVERMLIERNLPQDSVGSTRRLMSDSTIAAFIFEFNNAEPVGITLFTWTYRVVVFLEDGTQRQFRANGKWIKEKSDQTFSLADSSYLARLWLQNAPVCPYNHKDSIIPIVYGFPTSETGERARRGQVWLGGCEVDSASPLWHCTVHKNEF